MGVIIGIIIICCLCWYGNKNVVPRQKFEKEYYDNGNVKSEIPLKNGARNGMGRIYFPNGKIRIEIPFVDGRVNGVSLQYYKDGGLEEKVCWLNGARHGAAISYFPNGAIKNETEYVNDVKHGMSKTYLPNGALMQETPFVNGVIDGIEKEYVDDDFYGETVYAHGIKRDYKVWYDAKKQHMRLHMPYNSVGLLDGIVTFYYATGQKESVAKYENGHQISARKYFNESGIVQNGIKKSKTVDKYSSVEFKNGLKNGLEILYTFDKKKNDFVRIKDKWWKNGKAAACPKDYYGQFKFVAHEANYMDGKPCSLSSLDEFDVFGNKIKL